MEKKILYWIGSLTLLAVLVFFLVAAASVFSIRSDVHNTSQHIDRVLVVVGGAATKWEKASADQSQYLTASAKKTGEVLDAAKTTIAHLDETAVATKDLVANSNKLLNAPDGIITTVSDNINATLANTQDLISDTDKSLNYRGGLFYSLTYDMDSITSKVDDLAESMTLITGHADKFVFNDDARVLLSSMRGSAENIQASTDDLRKKVHQLVQPASFALRFGKGILTAGYQARGLFGL